MLIDVLNANTSVEYANGRQQNSVCTSLSQNEKTTTKTDTLKFRRMLITNYTFNELQNIISLLNSAVGLQLTGYKHLSFHYLPFKYYKITKII